MTSISEGIKKVTRKPWKTPGKTECSSGAVFGLLVIEDLSDRSRSITKFYETRARRRDTVPGSDESSPLNSGASAMSSSVRSDLYDRLSVRK